MSLRIKEDAPNLIIVRLDGGVPIFHYKGEPFTGIVFDNENDGSLAWEHEYENGYQEGWYRGYHRNGNKAVEYKFHNNLTIAGTYKKIGMMMGN